jgi:hypothetical protein
MLALWYTLCNVGYGDEQSKRNNIKVEDMVGFIGAHTRVRRKALEVVKTEKYR